MAIRPVLVYPNPMLRANTVEVRDFDQSLQELCIDLADTMRALNALGIAAPQIGDIRRVIALSGRALLSPGATAMELMAAEPIMLVNPVLTALDGPPVPMDEGCLSFPGVVAKVVRFPRATVKAKTPDGKDIELVALHQFAHALQHEVDHLDRRLLIDMVGPVKRTMIKNKFKKSPKHAARVDHVLAAQRTEAKA
jgi:peptide deformylase